MPQLFQITSHIDCEDILTHCRFDLRIKSENNNPPINGMLVSIIRIINAWMDNTPNSSYYMI